jgi:valyl-tRNA synthetase
MTEELAKVYDPKSVETEIYRIWQEAGAFNAEPGQDRRAFCIVIPPPNVTDVLHLGHALNNTLQDVVIRFRRMQQLNTLWMPGTDHAGIATQTMVEKRIYAEEHRKRTDFPREEFVARIQAWKDEYGGRILNQLKLMGCSCDWRRTRFTLDEVCARAVRAAFYKLFADGLIYRGKRLVNWDPATQTVLADDEVEYENIDGFFWDLDYPLTEPVVLPGGKTITHVTVATTRPETMLGDTAVAMNPRDPRAAALVGKCVRLPIVGRIIPIIADEHVVLPDANSDDEKARFSTGFLKVTPAHDPDDYAIGQRHLAEIAQVIRGGDPARAGKKDAELVFINILAPDGTISDKHGWDDATTPEAQNLLGMDRFEAREAVVEWFRQEGLLGQVRPYTHSVGHSYRSHVPIEPYLSDQWYVAVKKQIPTLPEAGLIEGTDVPANSLAGLALAPLLDGRLKFTPERYAATYRAWLENLRDWPISRQLWWGHQIPIWSRDLELPTDVAPQPTEHGPDARVIAAFDRALGQSFCGEKGKPGWLSGAGKYYLLVEDHPDKAGWVRTYFCPDPDSPKIIERLEKAGWQRDPDVLDTWFSSALWPFSTLGWPDETPELKTFYPGDVLCTAREIITLWVSRMVMMGQYCRGDIPFHDVFIHAMIQDGEGRKMSKSLGNGIDPLVVIDSHGADAMRFTVVSMTTQTQDVRMPLKAITLPDGRTVNSSEKFDIGRNFCNKLWNASRFAMMNLAGAPPWQTMHPRADLADSWILSRLNATIRDVTAAAEVFRFNELADTLYHFMWDDLCDWYLEIAKVRIAAGQAEPKAVLAHCLDVLLRLLHPITPFITEAIWHKLNEIAPLRGPSDEPAERLLITAQWPYADAASINPGVEQEFALLQDLIRQVRNVRTQHNVPPKRTVDAAIEATGPVAQLITDNLELLKSQAQIGSLTLAASIPQPPANAAAVSAAGARLYVLDIIDTAAERQRLTRQAETLRKGVTGLAAKLGNENFLAKAPADLVQRERQRLEKLQAELAAVEQAMAGLG